MSNDLAKLEELLPQTEISKKIFELYKKKLGKDVYKISKRALFLYRKKGLKIERAMADALYEYQTKDNKK